MWENINLHMYSKILIYPPHGQISVSPYSKISIYANTKVSYIYFVIKIMRNFITKCINIL